MITIFTPTFNRKSLLERCYIFLVNQTKKDFEWLIVDDGSTDDTKKFVNDIKKNTPFQITYIFQKNGGKHRAHNTAVKNCKNDYFLILDSDDILDKKCIEVLDEKIKKINDMENISGIIGNRFRIDNKEVMGTHIPNDIITSGLELYQKNGFHGDTLRLYKTKILKEYLFPEIENEKFIYENVVFDMIDTKYKLLTISDKLYYGEYQENGYTAQANKLKLNNPIGYSLSLKSAAQTALVFKKRVNWTILYIIWCRKMKIKGFRYFKNKILYILLEPVTWLFDLIKYPRFFYNIFKEEEEK